MAIQVALLFISTWRDASSGENHVKSCHCKEWPNRKTMRRGCPLMGGIIDPKQTQVSTQAGEQWQTISLWTCLFILINVKRADGTILFNPQMQMNLIFFFCRIFYFCVFFPSVQGVPKWCSSHSRCRLGFALSKQAQFQVILQVSLPDTSVFILGVSTSLFSSTLMNLWTHF